MASLLQDTRGTTTAEQILAICLVAIVGVAGWESFGETVKAKLSQADGTVATLSGTSAIVRAESASTGSSSDTSGSGDGSAAPVEGAGLPGGDPTSTLGLAALSTTTRDGAGSEGGEGPAGDSTTEGVGTGGTGSGSAGSGASAAGGGAAPGGGDTTATSQAALNNGATSGDPAGAPGDSTAGPPGGAGGAGGTLGGNTTGPLGGGATDALGDNAAGALGSAGNTPTANATADALTNSPTSPVPSEEPRPTAGDTPSVAEPLPNQTQPQAQGDSVLDVIGEVARGNIQRSADALRGLGDEQPDDTIDQVQAGLYDVVAGLLDTVVAAGDATGTLTAWAIHGTDRWQDTKDAAAGVAEAAKTWAKDPWTPVAAAIEECTGGVRAGTACVAYAIGPAYGGAKAAIAVTQAVVKAGGVKAAAAAVLKRRHDRDNDSDNPDGDDDGKPTNASGYRTIHPPPPAWLQDRFDAVVDAIRRGDVGPDADPKSVEIFLRETFEHATEVGTLKAALGGSHGRRIPNVDPGPGGLRGIHDFGERASIRRVQAQIDEWEINPIIDRDGNVVPLPEWVRQLPADARAAGEATVDVGKLNPRIAAGLGRDGPPEAYALHVHRMSAHHNDVYSPARPGRVNEALTEEVADMVNGMRQSRVYRPQPMPFEKIDDILMGDVQRGNLPPEAADIIRRGIAEQRRLEMEGGVNPYYRIERSNSGNANRPPSAPSTPTAAPTPPTTPVTPPS